MNRAFRRESFIRSSHRKVHKQRFLAARMPYRFSPSSLGLLKDCPRCFWLRFNQGVERPDGIFPSLPSGMDRVLKAHFDSFRGRSMLPPELAGLKGVELFDNVELLEAWRDGRRGIRWADGEGNVLMGAIDNLLKIQDKLVVLDYKTRGYPLRDDTHHYYQDQMDIYTFLLRKNGYPTEDYAYLLFYHPNRVNEGGDVMFHTDIVKLGISVSNAERIFREALQVLGQDVPVPSESCGFCRWAEQARPQPGQGKPVGGGLGRWM